MLLERFQYLPTINSTSVGGYYPAARFLALFQKSDIQPLRSFQFNKKLKRFRE